MSPLPLPRLTPEPGSFERMTALDAVFLAAETERTPMHIGAMSRLEGPPLLDGSGRLRLEELRRRVAERLHLVPRLRRTVAQPPLGLGRPVWVDDTDFDVTRHVRHVELPAPGTREQFTAVCCGIDARVLDRDKPLWELWFVTGLEDGSVGLLQKVHHALVDGISGVDVAAALLDLEPDPPAVEVPEWEPAEPPDGLRRLVDAQLQLVGRPASWTRAAGGVLRAPVDLVRGAAAAAGVAAPGRLVDHAPGVLGHLGPRRTLRWVTAPLEPLRAVAHDHGGRLNDAVLSVVAGGMLALLEHRGEDALDRHLQVLVPVSVRAEDQHGDLGNKVTGMLVEVPLIGVDAAERIEEVHRVVAAHRERHEADGIELALDGLELLPPTVLSVLARTLVHHQPLVDVIVTNVPGPPLPLYFMGARLLESVPIVPLGGNMTMGIAILSYDGDLTIAVHADPDAVPDLDVLLEGMSRALRDLLGEQADDRAAADDHASTDHATSDDHETD